MEKSVQITLIIVSAVIFLALVGLFTIYPTLPETNTMKGNGEASIDVMPDLVTINFNIKTKANTSKEAAEKNSEISDELITNLLKEGFERSDIQTQNYDIRQEYEWTESRERIPKGFVATHTIKVKMPTAQSDKIGSVIDAGVDANATISHINFELTSESENQYKAEAIKLATEDAKTKAEAIAEGLDKNLGKLVSVQQTDFNYQPWRAYSMDAEADVATEETKEQIQTSIQPSEQEISARVTATFKLK
ncbi:MAG: SIMPL domain-containing protein [Minisyncoccales bacterium]